MQKNADFCIGHVPFLWNWWIIKVLNATNPLSGSVEVANCITCITMNGSYGPAFFPDQVEGPEYEELAALHDSVHQQSVSWFASLQDRMKEQILSHFGVMPDREPEPQVCSPFSFIILLFPAVVCWAIVLVESLAVRCWVPQCGCLWASSSTNSPKEHLLW